MQALKDRSANVRAVAAHALGEVGGDPRRIVPELCQTLADRTAEVGKQARLALVNLGADAVPALQELLKSNQPALRRDAAQVLGMIGPAAKASAVDLALLLQDNEAQVRAAAAGALAALGKEVQAVIPALLEAMRREKRFEVQQQLFQALTLVGSRDLPGFLKAVREVDRQGQWARPFHLAQFGPRAEDAVKPLIQLLADLDPALRLAAASALGKLGLLSEHSVPALAKALNDPSPQVRLAAGFSLLSLAPEHERAAEFRLATVAKLLDSLLIATARREVASAVLARRLSAQQALAEALRPFNRQAALDPKSQAQYDEVLHLLIVVTKKPHLSLDQLSKQLESQVRALADALPMEAAPAVVRALNLIAIYQLGFC